MNWQKNWSNSLETATSHLFEYNYSYLLIELQNNNLKFSSRVLYQQKLRLLCFEFQWQFPNKNVYLTKTMYIYEVHIALLQEYFKSRLFSGALDL